MLRILSIMHISDRLKSTAIGLFTAKALCVLIATLFFLHPSFGDGKNTIRVQFADIQKVAVGTHVTFAGQPVGVVKKIDMLPDARATQADTVFPYELTLSLDSKVQVYPTDQILVKTSGLMGERTIAIIPQPLQQPVEPLKDNDCIMATTDPSVENLMQDITEVTKKLEKTVDALAVASTEAGKFFATMNDTNLVATCQTALANTNTLMEKINRNDGTIGKLLNNDDIYWKALGAVNKVNVLMNDLNNYGLLFHSNKTWQKDRSKRLEALAELRTTKDMREFLATELDKVTTAIAHIELAIEKANLELSNPPSADLLKTYDELLGEMDHLQKNLQLYRTITTEEPGYIVESSTK